VVGVILQKRESERTGSTRRRSRIKKLVEAESYVAAYALARRKAEKVIRNDPALKQYIESPAPSLTFKRQPPGASVSYKPYADVDGKYMNW